jgi:peptide/nickel transport system permease protein
MTGDINARKTLRRLFRNPLTVIGFILILANLIMVLLAPQISPFDPEDMHLPDRHTAPCARYLLGTDFYGRDILSRIIYGSRISFSLGISVVMGGLLLGTSLGLSAGYFGGKVDSLLMRITDVFLAFPQLVFAMAIMAIHGQGFGNVVFALTVVGWTAFARLVRAEALSLRSREFIQAAQSLGASNPRILFRHLLPNLLAPIIVQATMGMATPILTEAALTFLGIGMPPNIPSWGGMLSVDRDFMETAWWSITFPGLAIALTVLGFNLFGDGLRDALDPKLKS